MILLQWLNPVCDLPEQRLCILTVIGLETKYQLRNTQDNSGILQKTFGKNPYIRAIHAGLECGIIYKKFKNIDMISMGPTIRGAHTPEEKIEIRTTQMFWDLLIDVIMNIPVRN